MILNNLLLFAFISISLATSNWPQHNIDSLKLLVIIHRHGDRAPSDFLPNDPYQDADKYWPEGIGMLTKTGKYRMFKLGQFIRNEYDSYLGDGYSAREVYARSSVIERGVESAQCVLAGLYPPKTTPWQWSNGSDPQLGLIWQPIPIETFMPKSEDVVLNQDKKCPTADKKLEEIWNSEETKKFIASKSELFENISKSVGHEINTVDAGKVLYITLKNEWDNGYYWDVFGGKDSEKQMLDQLLNVTIRWYQLRWNHDLIKRMISGGFLAELNKNLRKQINGENNKKLYIYSSQSSQIAAYLNTFSVFNNEMPKFGEALFFELHQDSNNKTSDYYLKIYYHYETLSDVQHVPVLMKLPDCEYKEQCPIQQFFNLTQKFIYDDYNKECGL